MRIRNLNPILTLFFAWHSVHAFGFEIPSHFKIEDLSSSILDNKPSINCNQALTDRRIALVPLSNKTYLMPESDLVKTVVYPCAGTNSSLPFLLFKKATTVYMIDIHPAVGRALRANEKIELKYLTPKNYRSAMEMDNEYEHGEFQLNEILGELYLFDRDVRIKEVKLFSKDEMKDWSFKRDLSQRFPSYDGSETNASIVFDTGEGTPLRRLVYVQAHHSAGEQWWKTQIAKESPDAFIVMSAMQRFNLYSEDYEHVFAQWMGSLIHKKRGTILVEGKDTWPENMDYFEFTGTAQSGTVLKNIDIGYRNTVKISVNH